MRNILVLYNQSAGNDEGKTSAEHFKSYAQKQARDYHVVLAETGADVAKETLLQKATQLNLDTLVIIGGDGTIHHAIKDFESLLPTITLGIIPSGTVNNLAKVLELPLSEEEAFDVILADTTHHIDYGKVNEDVIISTLTIGILAETAANISQSDKQKLGPLVFISRFIKTLLKNQSYPIRLVSKEKEWQGKMQLLTLTMTNSVGGFTNFDENAEDNDGLLHVTLLPKLHFFKLLFALPKILRGKVAELDDTIYFTTDELTIESLGKTISTRTDGDMTDDLPVNLKVVKNSLEVHVPKNKK